MSENDDYLEAELLALKELAHATALEVAEQTDDPYQTARRIGDRAKRNVANVYRAQPVLAVQVQDRLKEITGALTLAATGYERRPVRRPEVRELKFSFGK